MVMGNSSKAKQAENYEQGIPSRHIDPLTRIISLSAHLDECCSTEPKFKMFLFFKTIYDSTSARLNKKLYFIKCFKPKLNVLNQS